VARTVTILINSGHTTIVSSGGSNFSAQTRHSRRSLSGARRVFALERWLTAASDF
jgi:hypothetical protein